MGLGTTWIPPSSPVSPLKEMKRKKGSFQSTPGLRKRRGKRQAKSDKEKDRKREGCVALKGESYSAKCRVLGKNGYGGS